MDFTNNSFSGKTNGDTLSFSAGVIDKNNNEFYSTDLNSIAQTLLPSQVGQKDNYLWGRFFGPSADVIGGVLRYRASIGLTSTVTLFANFMGTKHPDTP